MVSQEQDAISSRARVEPFAPVLEVSDPTLPWTALPAWLAFFMELGQQVAVAHHNGSTTCAVVIPPVRSFGSALAATGAVLGVARTADSIPDLDAHFSALCELPKGTSLVVKQADRIYAAAFRGAAERDGAVFLRVEYEHDGVTHYVPQGECHRVQVGSGGKRSLPKAGRRGRASGAAAIEGILGDRAAEFLSVPTVDAVLVGQVSLLEEELTTVAIRPAGHRDGVPLSALLRSSRFLPDGGISRSLVLSDRIGEFEMPVDDTPHVAVFDGARALSRYRSAFPQSSWIAVLDRCSTSLHEGVDVANEEFAVRRGPADHLDALDVPEGTEFQSFERGR